MVWEERRQEMEGSRLSTGVRKEGGEGRKDVSEALKSQPLAGPWQPCTSRIPPSKAEEEGGWEGKAAWASGKTLRASSACRPS